MKTINRTQGGVGAVEMNGERADPLLYVTKPSETSYQTDAAGHMNAECFH